MHIFQQDYISSQHECCCHVDQAYQENRVLQRLKVRIILLNLSLSHHHLKPQAHTPSSRGL